MHAVKCLVLFLMTFEIFETKPPASQFCTNTSPVSCAYQLWGQNASSSDDCNMWFPGRKTSNENNVKECAAMTFERGQLAAVPDLGKIKLTAYYGNKNGYTVTAFNVSFSEIRWKSLKMRFQRNKESLPKFCREFTISSNRVVPKEIELFYDCIWSNESIEHTAFNFEYQQSDEISTSVGRYLFNVPSSFYIKPSNTNLSQSELFTYIDLSHLPILTLRVQTANDRFNIGPENYIAFIHHTTMSGEKKTKLDQPVFEDGELLFAVDTKHECGSYYFTAKIDHEDCKKLDCFVTKTPTLVIPSDPHLRIVLIAIAGCGAAILSVLFFGFFLWRRRIQSLKERAPTVLLIYAPTTAKHVTAVVELAKYLNNFCHVEALIDELHISKTTTKDPFTWCNDAFKRSDFVMVLSSPYHNCNNYEGIYMHVDALGLRLLREKLSDRTSKQHFFSVVLPYCTERDIPSEAVNLRRFALTKDFNKMLSFLHTKSVSFYSQFCVQPMVYGHGSMSELASDGVTLLNAMKMAGFELGKKSCVCDQSDYESPALVDEFVTINLNESYKDLPSAVKREVRVFSDDVFPGPITQLNLLGNEGEDHTNLIEKKQSDCAEIMDINSLDLG